MALTTMKELLVTAQKEKYAVGAFEFWSLDSAQAIIDVYKRQVLSTSF